MCPSDGRMTNVCTASASSSFFFFGKCWGLHCVCLLLQCGEHISFALPDAHLCLKFKIVELNLRHKCASRLCLFSGAKLEAQVFSFVELNLRHKCASHPQAFVGTFLTSYFFSPWFFFLFFLVCKTSRPLSSLVHHRERESESERARARARARERERERLTQTQTQTHRHRRSRTHSRPPTNTTHGLTHLFCLEQHLPAFGHTSLDKKKGSSIYIKKTSSLVGSSNKVPSLDRAQHTPTATNLSATPASISAATCVCVCVCVCVCAHTIAATRRIYGSQV